MAKVLLSAKVNAANDAEYRAWGLAWHNAFAAIGLTQITQTGQVDWATAIKPTTINTWGPGEIWGLTDSLQGTAPIFIRVYYGVGTVATYLQMYLEVAFANDGAGNSIGNQTNGLLFATTIVDAASYNNYVAGDGSGIVVHAIENKASGNAGSYTPTIAIERTRDAAGNIDSRGANFVRIPHTSTVANVSAFIPRTGTFTGQYAGLSCPFPSAGSGAEGATCNLYPIRVQTNNGEQPPMTLIAGYFQADFQTNNNMTVTRWDGLNKTFRFINTEYTYCQNPGATVANPTATAFYWE